MTVIDILENKLAENFSPNTKKLYLNLFHKIHFALSPKSKNIRFLYDTKNVMNYLEDHYSTKSRRTYLGYVVGILKLLKNDVNMKNKHMDAIKEYKKLLKETSPGRPKVVGRVEGLKQDKEIREVREKAKGMKVHL